MVDIDHGDLEAAFEQVFADTEGNVAPELRKALIRGLIKAAEIAAIRAAATLRDSALNKERVRTAVITAVIVAAICIPVTYILSTEGRRVNCQLITKVAGAQAERITENKAATERFRRESSDRLGLTPKRFQELIAEGEAREEHQLAVYNEVASHTC